MLLRLFALARAPVELAEAEVAVGDEGAHAARLSEDRCFVVVSCATLGIEPVGMGRDVAEQEQSMRREPGLTQRRFDGSVGKASRLVELTEEQTGAAERMVNPAAMADGSARRETLEKALAFPELVQRFARLATLRQNPGGRPDPERK